MASSRVLLPAPLGPTIARSPGPRSSDVRSYCRKFWSESRRSCTLALRRFAFDVVQECHSVSHELRPINAGWQVTALEESLELIGQGTASTGCTGIGVALTGFRSA